MWMKANLSEEEFVECCKSMDKLEEVLDRVSSEQGYPWRQYGAFYTTLQYVRGEFSISWNTLDFISSYNKICFENSISLMHIVKYLSNAYKSRTKTVINNMPYFQIIKEVEIRNDKKYYCLNYEISSTQTRRYSYNKKLLLQLKRCMEKYNQGFEEFSINFIKDGLIIEDVERFKSSINSHKYHDIELKETSTYGFYDRLKENPRIKRLKEFKRKSNLCSVCGGGGGPCCEPWNYI